MMCFSGEFEKLFKAIFEINSYNSLLKFTTPLLLSSLSVTIAGRAGLLNIGVEGQIYLGAFIAAIIGQEHSFIYEKYLPTHILILVLFSLALPAIISSFCGYLKSSHKIHEVPTTLFSYLFIVACLNYLINLPWFSSPLFGSQTTPIKDIIFLPSYFQAQSLWPDIICFSIAMIFIIATWFVFKKTVYGIRLKGIGDSPSSFLNLGFQSHYYYISAMFFSGFIASLAGFLRICGQDGQYIENFSPGYGFIGLGIAFAAKYNLIDIVIITFGLTQLQCCVSQWRHVSNLPYEFLDLIQVIFVILIVLFRALQKKV